MVENLGNILINFTISPQTGNHTDVNVTNFTVEKNSNYTFSVFYNVTGVNMTTYQSNFSIDAIQADASPDKMNLIVVLLPYQPPLINLTILPESIEQTAYVEFFVNVTDRSDSGVAWVKVNVTRPNGTIDQINMTNTSIVDLLQGKADIHETMIALQKADISMRLLLTIRNKVIEAYREIMHMQF